MVAKAAGFADAFISATGAMSDMGQTNEEWISGRLRGLIGSATEIKSGGSVTEYGYHTAMKLVAMQYYAETFVKVVRKQVKNETADGAIFLDLFAGTGLVKIKGSSRGDLLPGSTCCAALIKNGFDYLVGIEKSPPKRAALEGRLAGIMREDQFDILQGDCNAVIDDAISLIWKRFKRPIVLTFADPEGIEIKASTLRRISKEFERCDFIINVNAEGLSRVAAKYKKGIHNVKRSLEEFMDSGIEELLAALENVPPQKVYYERIMEDTLGKPVGSTIKIREGRSGVAYYLLGYTRQTSGGPGYAKALRVLKERLEALNADAVRREINKIQGGQKTLDGAGWRLTARAGRAQPPGGQKTLDGH